MSAMGLAYNGMKMTDGTEFRVLLSFGDLVRTLNEGLRASRLVTLPMGMHPPGSDHTVNPQQVVSLTNYMEAG
jgi:hypothetical protein